MFENGSWLIPTAVIEVLPAMNTRKSARDFCRQIESEMGAGDRLSSYRLWRVHADYPYYLDRAIPNLDDPQGLPLLEFTRPSGLDPSRRVMDL